MLKYMQALMHQPEAIFFMREAVLNGFNKVESTGKFESGNSATGGVAVKWELNPKEILEKVSVGASLKWRTEI
jgi:hypothetical protein